MRKFIGKVGFYNTDRVMEYHIRAWTMSKAYNKLRNRFLRFKITGSVRFINIQSVRKYWNKGDGSAVMI